MFRLGAEGHIILAMISVELSEIRCRVDVSARAELLESGLTELELYLAATRRQGSACCREPVSSFPPLHRTDACETGKALFKPINGLLAWRQRFRAGGYL